MGVAGNPMIVCSEWIVNASFFDLLFMVDIGFLCFFLFWGGIMLIVI